jgi:hypothetical protein
MRLAARAAGAVAREGGDGAAQAAAVVGELQRVLHPPHPLRDFLAPYRLDGCVKLLHDAGITNTVQLHRADLATLRTIGIDAPSARRLLAAGAAAHHRKVSRYQALLGIPSYFFADRLELEHSLERCGNAVSLLRFVQLKNAHLPRQARDKHTRTLNRRRFCRVESVELHGDGSLTHSLKREREDEALLLAAGLDPATQQSHPALVRSLLLQAEALRLKARGQQGAIVAELAKRTEASLRLLQPAEPRTEIAAAETMRTIAEQFAPPPPPPDRHDWHYC